MSIKKQFNGSADELESAFYDAISRSDLDGLMELWAEDEEIICIHPGSPRLIGHAAIRASWLAIFASGSVQIHATQLHATQNILTAVHSVIEDIRHQNDMEHDQVHDLHIIATNVYLKTPQGWRIATHHASVAPGAQAHEFFAAGILH